jgi:hypothetical protein
VTSDVRNIVCNNVTRRNKFTSLCCNDFFSVQDEMKFAPKLSIAALHVTNK